MGFPSVCCEYVLFINKEAALAYEKAEYSKVRKPSRDKGGKKAESGRWHVATEEETYKKHYQ